MSPIVSILIPVYNTKDNLLQRCVESCLNQTLSDIEIVIVDDGSKNETAELCNQYLSDPRVKVIHQKNGGLCNARNTAFDHAEGNYIMFLDSDDYLDKHTCEIAYSKADTSNADVVFWDVVAVYPNGGKKRRTTDTGGKIFFYKEDCKQLQLKVLDFDGNFAQVFAKLIRRDLLTSNDIRHDENLRQGAEGLVFNVKLFEHVSSAIYLNEGLNFYVYDPDSISHSHNEQNYYYILKCFEEIIRFSEFSDNRAMLISLSYTRLLYVIVTTAISGFFNPDNTDNYRMKCDGMNKFMGQKIVKDALKYGDLKKISNKRKFILFCIRRKMYAVLVILAKARRQQQILK